MKEVFKISSTINEIKGEAASKIYKMGMAIKVLQLENSSLTVQLANAVENVVDLEEHFEGTGCTCEAHGACECCCEDADWRSVREVQLEEENVKLRKVAEAAREVMAYRATVGAGVGMAHIDLATALAELV